MKSKSGNRRSSLNKRCPIHTKAQSLATDDVNTVRLHRDATAESSSRRSSSPIRSDCVTRDTQGRIKNGPRPSVWVAEILRDIDSDQHMVRLEFDRVDGEERGSLLVNRSILFEPMKLAKLLYDAGAQMPANGKRRSELLRKLLRQGQKKVSEVTTRTGWRGDTFVMPHVSYGDAAGSVKFRGDEELSLGLSETSGELDAFNLAIHPACEASDIVLFSVALGLAGPLLGLLEVQESAGWALVGESSTGKSFSQTCCLAVMGNPEPARSVSFDAGQKALQELAVSRNDLTLVVDEVARLGGSAVERRKAIKNAAYLLASGTGRTYASFARRDPALQNDRWRTLLFTSSEQHLGNNRADGEAVRLIEIPVPRRSDGGIFNRLDERGKAQLIIHEVQQAIRDHHGVLLHAYLESITRDVDRWRRYVIKRRDRFVEKVAAAGSGLDHRLAAKFGIVYAAAAAAAKMEIAPWSVKRARRAIRSLHSAARAAIPMEFADAVARLAELASDERKMPLVEKNVTLPTKAWCDAVGFRRTERGALVLFFDPAALPELLTRDLRANLAEEGLLLPGTPPSGSVQRRVRGSANQRRYVPVLELELLRKLQRG